MFRVTPFARNIRTVLHCRKPVEVHLTKISSISRFPPLCKPKERETCPPPLPPPPPKPKDDSVFWGTMAVLVLAAGFAVYAHQNPEIRDWLSLNAAWFDDIIAVVYQENMSYKEFAAKCVEELKCCITRQFKDAAKEEMVVGNKPEAMTDKKEKEDNKGGSKSSEKCVIQAKDTCCEDLPDTITSNDICEVEKCLTKLGDSVIKNYVTAKDACSNYNKLIQNLMMNFDLSILSDLREAMVDRVEVVNAALENIEVATNQFDELSRYFECCVKAPPELIERTKTSMTVYREKIKISCAEFKWDNELSLNLDEQWQKVEATVLKYTEENMVLIPGLSYDNLTGYLSGDADLLLYHAYRCIKKLSDQLPEPMTAMTDRVNRGVETLPQDEKSIKATNAKIQTGTKQMRGEMEKDFRRRSDDQKAANDNAVKEASKKQLERHEETLRIRLAQTEKEVSVKLNKMVAEKVAAEKKLFSKQLKEMEIKLKIVEDKLNERLKAERESRRSQELWTAGASLLAATKKGDPYVRVDKELTAIEKASASGDGDQLVLTVLKAIPASVRENGVVPESVLRERYHKMEKVALRVALVESEGAPLPVFFLSFMQSILLFMKLSGIPQAEIDKPPQAPFPGLDTFDLLQRARFWIERGNLAIALRYVNSLQGASRAAADRWYEAARSHLETRQAAEAVLAHAAALGLQYI